MTIGLSFADKITERVIAELTPHCRQIKVVGKIRRRKEDIDRIEILCEPIKDDPGFASVVDKWGVIADEPGFMRRILPEDIVIDIHTCISRNFGLQTFIRTGPSNYCQMIFEKWAKAGYIYREGFLWKNKERINIKIEKKLFELLGLSYRDPETRF